MQTSFTNEFLSTVDGKRVNEILRSCVHCGFCNATCPTYQLTGDELDGPRGRIYLLKNYFEEPKPDVTSMHHLDRCLTCLACETTCPSGVEYGSLLDIGRAHIESSTKRPMLARFRRNILLRLFSNSSHTAKLLFLARLVKPILPKSLASKIPARSKTSPAKLSSISNPDGKMRKMLTIPGCVQSKTAPQINHATAQALNRSGIELDEANTQCCGALAFHMGHLQEAKHLIRNNVEEWHQKLQEDHELLLITSSGCSQFIKQYSTIMQDDPMYAKQAQFVVDRTRDLAELDTEIKPNPTSHAKHSIAFHNPCSLQHGQKINGSIEDKLKQLGHTLVEVQDMHICCGSAGSYSLLETELSSQLLTNKVKHLEANQPDLIVTANIGCLLHIQSATDIPVKHWIELLT